MSDFAVIVVQSTSTSMPTANVDSELSIARAEELRELERELECPVCMDISQPPIYQCEEGHIIWYGYTGLFLNYITNRVGWSLSWQYGLNEGRIIW